MKIIENLKSLKSLNDWEKGFLESVGNQFNCKGDISDRQAEILEKIRRKHSPEEAKRREEWRNSYNAEKREVALVCAKYYLSAGYFKDLAMSIVEDESFVPTERQFIAMCENKYAKRVLNIHYQEPKFPVGSLAVIRSSDAAQISQKYKGVTVAVISHEGIITSAARDAKPVLVLPVGESTPLLTEERWLKKLR